MARRRLLAASGLAAIGLLTIAGPALAVNDPGYHYQWNMDIVGAPTAWATSTGKGVTIAVVDTGVHLTQEDLAPHLLPGKTFVSGTSSAQDDYGHGTHVAGIAAALANNGRGVVGVAPEASILPVKVLDRTGSGSDTSVENGVRWAVDNGAKVINLSLGDQFQGAPLFGPGFTSAIDYAWSKGVVCVVAAGNDFVTGSGFKNEPAIVVSATDRSDGRPTYSSGVGLARWGIAAPGGADPNTALRDLDLVFSTYWDKDHPSDANRYAWDAGTSMAAPHVSGAVALLLALGLTPQQAVDRLLATAKDIGLPGRDTTFGAGRLDVAKAVSGYPSITGGGPTTSTTTRTTTTTAARVTTTTPRPTTSPTAAASGGATAAGGAGKPVPTTAGPGATTSSSASAEPAPLGDQAAPLRITQAQHPGGGRPKPWAAASFAGLLLAGVGWGTVAEVNRPL
jgi:subtilisin family serine protease